MNIEKESDVSNLITAMTPQGIETQEARGQVALVNTDVLPKECPRGELEKLGFVFKDNMDDIFIEVQFPDGWKKEATDHSMWSDLLDDKGRKRGAIFYKAAFYDRNAHMHLVCRYTRGQNFEIQDALQKYALDCGKVLYKTKEIKAKQYSDEYFAASDLAEEEVTNWLNDNYPDYKDPMKYWS